MRQQFLTSRTWAFVATLSLYALTLAPLASAPRLIAQTQPSAPASVAVKQFEAFHKLRLEGHYRLHIKQGDEYSVAIANPATNPWHALNFRLHKDTLLITPSKQGNHPNVQFDQPLELTIVVKDLQKLVLTGTTNISCDLFKARSFGFETRGSVQGSLHIDTQKFSCHTIGDCALNLSGQSQSTTLTIDGGGEIHAQNLHARNEKVVMRGNGKAEVHADERLQVVVHGAGNVHYVGNPKLKTSLFGLGSVASLPTPMP